MITIDETKSTELYIMFLELFIKDINIKGPTTITGATVGGLENQTITIDKELSQRLFQAFVQDYINILKDRDKQKALDLENKQEKIEDVRH